MANGVLNHTGFNPDSNPAPEQRIRCAQCLAFGECNFHCSECADSPSFASSLMDTIWYCSDSCKRLHYSTHYDECIARQNRRVIYRLGHFCQKMLLKIWDLVNKDDSLHQPDSEHERKQRFPALLSWKAALCAMALFYKIACCGLIGITEKGCSFRISELAITLKHPECRTPPDKDASQDLNPLHFIYVVKLCNDENFALDQTEDFAVDLTRKQSNYLDGPVQTLGRYYRSQVKHIDFEVDGGYSFIAIALARYIQTPEGRKDSAFCNSVSMVADILKTQKVTCPFALALNLPEGSYNQRIEILVSHLDKVLRSMERRLHSQMQEWRATVPSGIEAFQLKGYMSEEKQVMILVELSLDAVSDRHFEPGFLATLLRSLGISYPWARDYISQRIEQISTPLARHNDH